MAKKKDRNKKKRITWISIKKCGLQKELKNDVHDSQRALSDGSSC